MTNRLSEVEYEGEDIVEPIKNKIDGTKLKNVRLEKEILINKIADFLGIKPIQYCDVEHGRQYMYIGHDAQKKLAEFLGIDDIKKVLVDPIEQFKKNDFEKKLQAMIFDYIFSGLDEIPESFFQDLRKIMKRT